MQSNIVAQFACSLDSNGEFIEYPVVVGSTINESFNETLDSGSIIIDQVKNRLIGLKPYQYVRIFSKDDNSLDKICEPHCVLAKGHKVHRQVFSCPHDSFPPPILF